MDVLNYSIRRNLLNSIEKGKATLHSHVETRVKLNNINNVQSGLGNNWRFVDNNAVRDGGRIWVMWDAALFCVIAISKEVQVIKDADIRSLWTSLVSMSSGVAGPWLVMGDFNNVLYFYERIGSKEGDARVFSRIDRVMANVQWILSGPTGTVNFLPEGLFDHSPCIFNIWDYSSRKKGSFKYFTMLSKDEKFTDVVKQVWLRKEQLPNLFKDLEGAKNLFLGQKAKISWMQCNDENTHYFDNSIKSRRSQNKVLSITDMNGNMCSDNNCIENAFIEYYKHLLGSSEVVNKVNPRIVRRGKLVSDTFAAVMVLPVTVAEVQKALFSIPSEKAPRPDGYSSCFLKNAYEVNGKDVLGAVMEFFVNGQML
ncbi:uncharacterized protein LOC141631276 [Silene latifolia]|uniref:uncharacterized protein LOC141631276 n=1 Tax=Silene latifolia TaxID=37657 RepID=UPI003D774EB5